MRLLSEQRLACLSVIVNFFPTLVAVFFALFTFYFKTLTLKEVLIQFDTSAFHESLWSSFFAAIPLAISSSEEVFQSWKRLLSSKHVEMELKIIGQNIFARLFPSLTILLPNLLLRFSRFPGSSSMIIGLIQIIIVSNIVTIVAVSSDKRLTRKKKWSWLLTSLNGAGFILGNIASMKYVGTIANPWQVVAIGCHAVAGGIVLWRLCYIIQNAAMESRNQALSNISSLNAEKRIQALIHYILFLVLVVIDLRSTICFSLDTASVQNRTYLLSCILVAISCVPNRMLRDTIILVGMAATMNHKFIRFISHELRSHLSYLTIGLDQLGYEAGAPDGDDEERRTTISEMKESLGSTVQILNDVIVFGELLRTSSRKAARQPVEVETALRRVVTNVQPLVSDEYSCATVVCTSN